MRVLAGDIGGTKTLLRIAECSAGRCRAVREQRFDSGSYDSLSSIIREFLKDEKKKKIRTACFGIAGPIRETTKGQSVKVTNLPWVWNQDHYAPVATEGGHANFAPTNELQIELTRHLLKNAGRTSWELVLSGHGLVELYGFLKARGNTPESPSVAGMMQNGDAAAAITQAALEQNDALANQALDLFVDIYGAQAGNLALTAGATGGVYIAGGIAPKIISRLTDGRFMRAFRSKGNMSHFVAAIPVQVVVRPEVGLIGAVLAAARLK